MNVCELKIGTVYLFNFLTGEGREYRVADNKKDGWEIQNPDGWDLGFVRANDIESITEVKEPDYKELYAELRTKYDAMEEESREFKEHQDCLLYTSPSPRDRTRSRMPSSA